MTNVYYFETKEEALEKVRRIKEKGRGMANWFRTDDLAKKYYGENYKYQVVHRF